jgi:hypothetical protein
VDGRSRRGRSHPGRIQGPPGGWARGHEGRRVPSRDGLGQRAGPLGKGTGPVRRGSGHGPGEPGSPPVGTRGRGLVVRGRAMRGRKHVSDRRRGRSRRRGRRPRCDRSDGVAACRQVRQFRPAHGCGPGRPGQRLGCPRGAGEGAGRRACLRKHGGPGGGRRRNPRRVGGEPKAPTHRGALPVRRGEGREARSQRPWVRGRGGCVGGGRTGDPTRGGAARTEVDRPPRMRDGGPGSAPRGEGRPDGPHRNAVGPKPPEGGER